MKKKQLLAWMLSVVMAVSAIPANMFAVSASEIDFVMEETKTVDEDAGFEVPAEVSMQEEDVSFEDVFSAEDELPVDEMLPDAEETFIPEGTDEIETVPVKEEDTAAAEQDSLPEDTALEDVFFDEVFEEGTEEYRKRRKVRRQNFLHLRKQGSKPQKNRSLRMGSHSGRSRQKNLCLKQKRKRQLRKRNRQRKS